MSWHLPHQFTTLHCAVSIALSCSISLLVPTAQAATLGSMQISSQQHEPLSASISVSNIDVATFNASIASPSMYQQMGLTPTTAMSVRFVPSSANSGQLVIRTAQPVSAPFADVVLTLTDNGKRQVIPKTLLMPLSDSLPINKATNQTQAASPSRAPKPNLPRTSNLPATPLTVKRSAPPPLFDSPANDTSATHTTQAQPLAAVNMTAAPTLPTTTPTLPQSSPQPRLQSSPVTIATQTGSIKQADEQDKKPIKPVLQQASAPMRSNKDSALQKSALQQTDDTFNSVNDARIDNPAPISTPTGKQHDILNIQVTRQIKARKRRVEQLIKNSINPNNAVTTDDIPAQLRRPDSALGPISTKASVTPTPADTAPVSTNDAHTAVSDSNQLNSNNPRQPTTKPHTQGASINTFRYTVQQNDNLWIIANQLATQNNLDVKTVMSQIQAQNPNAFINADANRLKADATLDLPDYDVVPSQQSLQTAIAAQRQYYLQKDQLPKATAHKKPLEKKAINDAPAAPITKASNETARADSIKTNKPTKTTKTLPQARFSVVAPNQKGQADGTQSQGKSVAKKGNGLSGDILTTLQAARQRTAEQAQRVKATQSMLGSHTQKLQLQNKKLAELEARLKKLRNQ